MECKIKNRHKLISDYLMGELLDDDAKIFEEHYFQCEVCFKELKIAEDAISLIKNEGTKIFKPEGKFEANRKLFLPGLSAPLRWGIAFSSIVILAVVLYFLFQNKQGIINEKIISQEENTFPNDKIVIDSLEEKKLQPNNNLAELNDPAFKPDPYFEEWITENVRSENIIDTIVSPETGERFYNQNILFHVKMKNFGNGISLKILNNLEKEIFMTNTNIDEEYQFKVQITPEVFNKSGLYYWRIENENEVLFTGKFYFLNHSEN